MKKALVFEGQIVQIESVSFPVAPALIWIDVSDDVSMETHDFDGAAVVLKPKPPAPTTEQLSTSARSKRDSLLAVTDWTQAGDIPQSTKDLWIPYRQDLRDVPEQVGFPVEIVWPTKP